MSTGFEKASICSGSLYSCSPAVLAPVAAGPCLSVVRSLVAALPLCALAALGLCVKTLLGLAAISEDEL
jgi:hypothetical protein